jgi:lysophospholipase
MRLGSILTLDGARHELLQEADRYREPFLAAFDAFIPGMDDGTL